MRKISSLLPALFLALAAPASHAAPVGTAFTYQGELKVSSAPANGAYDFQFALYSVATGGSVITAAASDDANVASGLFSVEIDFGELPFAAAQEYFIEVWVRDGASSGGYQQLLPRQKVTPTPYAVTARTVQAGGVNQGAIAPAAVGTTQLQTSAVGTAQIGNLAVTGAKIADGSISAAKLAFTAGDVTAVDAGNGLSGGGSSGDLQLAVDTSVIQTRVSGSCPSGEYLRAIAADGTASCESLLAFIGIKLASAVDDPANSVGQYSDIAIGNDGFAVISYYDQTAAALKVAKCSNAACTGARISAVDDPPTAINTAGEYSSIAIGNDGLPVISYLQTQLSPGALKVAKCANPDCSGVATITTVDDPVNGVGSFSSIAIGSDGLPVISYWDNSANALKVAQCANADCSGVATITTVDDPANNVGQYTAIAIGADGLPVISYYDSSAGALKVAKCANAACTGTASITTLDDPVQQVGQYTSIVVGGDGLPTISYFDLSGALSVAKCNNPSCNAGASITRVDQAAGAITGRYSSIAIGSDGLPVISYEQAFGASTLKVAKCTNAACSGSATLLTTVDDPANSVGQHSAIAVGSDGLPVISYYDATAGTLRLIKCGTRSCQ